MEHKKIPSFKRRLFPVLLFSMVTFTGVAQDSTAVKNDSTGIRRAIYWAKKGQHDKAKEICRSFLLKHPQDPEAAILLGRLYSWNKQFDSARTCLKNVLSRQPANEEALQAIINVELWSNQLDQALVYCDKALALSPGSESLLIKKAKVYNKQAKYKEASQLVEQVLRINPVNEEALRFREYLKKKTAVRYEKSGIGLLYQHDHFNNSYAPWDYASLYLFHKSKIGMVSGSVNYASRFRASGVQYEINLYPRISSSMRAYLGAAYSKDSVFPSGNFGAGLYHKLFEKAELDAGIRYLTFSRLPDPILIYTGAISISSKRVWTSFRTYLTPQPAGISQSYYLTGRYYMNNPKNNITLIVNTGLSPNDYLDPISGKTYNFPTKSNRVKMAFQTVFLSQKNILKCSLAYERRIYNAGIARERISTGIGIERLF
jgi:YaiO family outer membrane protein